MTPKRQSRKQWTAEEKQALFADFEASTNGGEQGKAKQWFKDRKISSAWFYNARKKFMAEQPKSGSKPRKTKSQSNPQSTALATTNGYHQSKVTPALLAEYEALPDLPKGNKSQWMADRGINSQNLYDARKRREKAPHTAQPHFTQVLPAAAPVPVVTLDDAIAAMQVRQDLFAEFLDQLKRMQRIGR